MNPHSKRRFVKTLVGIASLSSVVLMSAGNAFADTNTFNKGQIVDVWTYNLYGHDGLSVALSNDSGLFADIPVKFVKTDGNYAEFQFAIPDLGNVSRATDALLFIKGRGAVRTRFHEQNLSDFDTPYGTRFTYEPGEPAGQLPEVPWAGLLPGAFALLLAGYVVMKRRAVAQG